MNFSIDKQDRYSVFTLSEAKLNSLLAPELKSELYVLNNEGQQNIVFDVSDVTFIDSSGLSAILIGNRICKNAGGSFVLAGVNENVSKLLRISQLDNILHIVPTVQEGIDLVLMEEVERDINSEE